MKNLEGDSSTLRLLQLGSDVLSDIDFDSKFASRNRDSPI